MEPLRDEEAREVVRRGRLAVLSLARANEAYAFPLFYGFQAGAFYFHSHPGVKDDFIGATEQACLTIVEAHTEDHWYSVMAFGRVRKATLETHLREAMDALLHVPAPPELGRTELGEPKRSMENVNFWRLEPVRIDGRKSEPPHPS